MALIASAGRRWSSGRSAAARRGLRCCLRPASCLGSCWPTRCRRCATAHAHTAHTRTHAHRTHADKQPARVACSAAQTHLVLLLGVFGLRHPERTFRTAEQVSAVGESPARALCRANTKEAQNSKAIPDSLQWSINSQSWTLRCGLGARCACCNKREPCAT